MVGAGDEMDPLTMDHETVPPKQILVGVGDMDSADAIALGRVLAGAFGDELRLVHVHRSGHPDAPGERRCPPELEMLGAGSPAAGLQEALDNADVRLAVLGSPGQGFLARALASGVGERLLSGGAALPVVVAPRGYARDPAMALRAVGCGFDGSSEAWGAWQEACRIAEKTDAALHVYVLTEGRPANVLREAARKLDLLVVGSRGLGSLESALLGSESRKLMGSTTCPVMVVPQPHPASEVKPPMIAPYAMCATRVASNVPRP